MPVSPDTLIAERYKLLECLGAGGMGEVWRAQDTKFTRVVSVAVKLLKEDETLAQDERNRSNFVRRLQRDATGPLTLDVVVDALAETFDAGFLRGEIENAARAAINGSTFELEAAVALFDRLVTNPAYNENARHRRRLRELFEAEANAVAILQHPNIVRVTDYGEHRGVPFLVMDYIRGRTLQQVVQRHETMAMTRRLRLMEDLCEGLGYAHNKELVHRDIKPANLIIESDSQRLKILDFGVVRSMELTAQRTMTMGVPIGTLCYMSPEQTKASRTLDNRSDIFSVGLVFYELLTYQRAFAHTGDVGALVYRIQQESPQPLRELLPELDDDIEKIVYKAIEKSPAKRYRDLFEMQRQILAIRTRLEEDERRLAVAQGDGTVLVRPKPLAQQIADFVDQAAGAFETEDDKAAIEFCDAALALQPNQRDAVELRLRALERIRRRRTEEIVDSARELLARGEITDAAAVLASQDIDTQATSVQRFTRDVEAARLTRRIGRLLGESEDLLRDGAVAPAQANAQTPLDLNPRNTEAKKQVEAIRAAMAETARREARAAAERALEEQRLAEQRRREEEEVRRQAEEAERKAEEQRRAAAERQRQIEAARARELADGLSRARELMIDEKFEGIEAILASLGGADPAGSEIAAFRREVAMAQAAVVARVERQRQEEERRQAEARQHAEAERLAEQRRREEEKAARQAAAKKRKADEAQRAEEERQRQLDAARAKQLSEGLSRARELLHSGNFAGIDAILEPLKSLDPSDTELAAFRREVAAAQAAVVAREELRRQEEERRQEEARARAEAERLAEEQRLAAAAAAERARLAAAQEAERKRIADERARQLAAQQDEERRAAAELARQLEEKRQEERRRAAAERQRQLDEARQQEEQREAAERSRQLEEARQEEQRRVQAQQALAALERAVDAAIANATALFDAGERSAALDVLRSFPSPHPQIDDALQRFAREDARLNDEARIAAERAEHHRRGHELLAAATAAASTADFAAAFRLVAEAANFTPAEAAALKAELITALRAAAVADAENPALRALRRRYDPVVRRRVFINWAATGIAAAAIVAAAPITFDVVSQWLAQGDVLDVGGNDLLTGRRSADIRLAPDAVAPAPPEVPVPVAEARLVVDLKPWARVTITSDETAAPVSSGQQLTPFAIPLPPGRYVIRAENGGISRPFERTVTLTAGQQLTLIDVMPGFDANRIVETLIGQER